MNPHTLLETQQKLVKEIFDHIYPCNVAPLYLDVAIPPPQSNDVTSHSVPDVHNEVQYRYYNPNEQLVLDAMFGHTRYSGNEEADKTLAKTPIDVNMTINQMAEVIFIGGVFTFQNPEDADIIVTSVDEYLNIIHTRIMQEIHYKGPPEDDIKKLERLANAIRPLAMRIQTLGAGASIWSELESIFVRTGEFVVGEDNTDFVEECYAVTKPDSGNHRRNLPDPYKF